VLTPVGDSAGAFRTMRALMDLPRAWHGRDELIDDRTKW
jgi:hypothetical protein